MGASDVGAGGAALACGLAGPRLQSGGAVAAAAAGEVAEVAQGFGHAVGAARGDAGLRGVHGGCAGGGAAGFLRGALLGAPARVERALKGQEVLSEAWYSEEKEAKEFRIGIGPVVGIITVGSLWQWLHELRCITAAAAERIFKGQGVPSEAAGNSEEEEVMDLRVGIDRGSFGIEVKAAHAVKGFEEWGGLNQGVGDAMEKFQDEVLGHR